MLIKRLVIKITTEKEPFLFDHTFKSGINIIASNTNTSGKSSVISAIMYGLGMEEIIGGKGSKVLSAAFNNKIKDTEGRVLTVLKADIYLEISNEISTITIFRSVKDSERKDDLMTIIDGTYDQRLNPKVKKQDLFVHAPNSAKGDLGFFSFLEKFINLDLPDVMGYDGKDKKLYLQNIFAATIIEQKRGWGDILVRVPNYGIKDPKKKTIEYILALDSIELSKKKLELREQIKELKIRWRDLYIESDSFFKSLGLSIEGITKEINYIDTPSELRVIHNEKKISLHDLLELKKQDHDRIIQSKYEIKNNNNSLNDELLEIINDINKLEVASKELLKKRNKELNEIKNLEESLEKVNNDIQNNKDIKKIIEYGAKEGGKIFQGVCPTCNQEISDTSVISQHNSELMSPEENITHLSNQKVLFESIINQKHKIVKRTELEHKEIVKKIKKLNFLAVSVKEDLYKISDEYTEHTIIEKIELETYIQKLEECEMRLSSDQKSFIKLSSEYKNKKSNLLSLPKDDYSKTDMIKINSLKHKFIDNLFAFGYKSTNSEDNIGISLHTLLPESMGYDLKFDSSASDHIRSIWAYTIALQEVSLEYQGNHPNFIIFDEPGQHRIVEEDMKALLDKIDSLSEKVQTVIGFTINEQELDQTIDKLSVNGNFLKIETLAFKKEN